MLINGVRTCYSNSAMAEVFQTMHSADLISIKIHGARKHLRLLLLNWEKTTKDYSKANRPSLKMHI